MTTEKKADLTVLPIDEVAMPTEDVSDLREVVDAINKLCDTMKSSYDADYEDSSDALQGASDPASEPESSDALVQDLSDPVSIEVAAAWSELRADAEMYYSAYAEQVTNWRDPIVEDEPIPEEQTPARIETLAEDLASQTYAEQVTIWSDPIVEKEPTLAEQTSATNERCETYYMASSEIEGTTEAQFAEKWSELTTETEPAAGPYEPCSEMYYTASSEVSLLSETDLEKVNDDSDKEKGDRSIMAGHVAAMRERFESMTRANTPCPDLVRSLSPSLDVFRNITPSPDFLDKS